MKRIPLFVLFILASCSGFATAQISFEKQIEFGYTIFPNSIVQALDGSFYISGYFYKDSSSFPGTSSFPFLAKTDESGKIEWLREINTDHCNMSALTATHDSGIVMMTLLGSNMYLFHFNKNDSVDNVTVMHIDAADQSFSIHETPDHGFIMAYSALAHSFISKLDPKGIVQWEHTVNFDGDVHAVDVISYSDSSYVLCSITLNDPFESRFILTKFSSSGDALWHKVNIRNGFSSLIYGMTKTSDAGFVICGSADDPSSPTTDLFIAKFNANGQMIRTSMTSAFGTQNAMAITELQNHDLAIVGNFSATDQTLDQPIGGKLVTAILSSSGDVKVLKTLNLLPDFPTKGISIIATRDGGYAVIGSIVRTAIDRSVGAHPYPPSALVFIKGDNSSICHFENSLFTGPPEPTFDFDTAVGVAVNKLITNSTTINTPQSIDFKEYDICTHYSVPHIPESQSVLTVSPNPLLRGETVTIHLAGSSESGTCELRIYGLLGNIFFKEKIGAEQDISLDVSGLAAGMYVVEVKTENGNTYRTKFVKE